MNTDLLPNARQLGARCAAWTRALLAPPGQDMSLDWSCCGAPRRGPTPQALGASGAVELTLHTCTHCGMHWLRLQSPLRLRAHWEPVFGDGLRPGRPPAAACPAAGTPGAHCPRSTCACARR